MSGLCKVIHCALNIRGNDDKLKPNSYKSLWKISFCSRDLFRVKKVLMELSLMFSLINFNCISFIDMCIFIKSPPNGLHEYIGTDYHGKPKPSTSHPQLRTGGCCIELKSQTTYETFICHMKTLFEL